MPKQTFFNLPAEKRQRLLDAAQVEFRTYSFSEASISHIIERANISRGSFYQYFEDKADLYAYYGQMMKKDYGAKLVKILQANQGDYFASFRSYIDLIVDEVFQGDDALFYAKMMEARSFEVFHKFHQKKAPRLENERDARFIYRFVDKSKLNLSDFEDFKMLNNLVVGGIFHTIMQGLVMKQAQGKADLERLKQNYKRMLDLLQYGAGKTEGKC